MTEEAGTVEAGAVYFLFIVAKVSDVFDLLPRTRCNTKKWDKNAINKPIGVRNSCTKCKYKKILVNFNFFYPFRLDLFLLCFIWIFCLIFRQVFVFFDLKNGENLKFSK